MKERDLLQQDLFALSAERDELQSAFARVSAELQQLQAARTIQAEDDAHQRQQQLESVRKQRDELLREMTDEVAALVLPLSERSGYWDHWLSWALYSPHNSRAEIQIHQSAVDQLPQIAATYLMPDDDADGRFLCDLEEQERRVSALRPDRTGGGKERSRRRESLGEDGGN